MVIINDVTDKEPADRIFSEKFACPYDGTSLPEIEPRTFSFNSPHGACEECQGLGTKLQIDPDMIVPNPDRSLKRRRPRGDGMERRGPQ